MKDVARLLEEPDTTVAVVGATDNPSKYGHVIYRDLKRKGFQVYPVNPRRERVDGDRAYPSLMALAASGVKPTIVNVVVPPAVAEAVLKDCLVLDLRNVWLQPGAESPKSLEFLQEQGFNYLANACIMVASRLKTH